MFAHSRLSSGYFVILHYYWRVSLHYIVPALLYYCAVHHQMTDNNSQCSIFMHVKFIYSEKSTKFCKIFTLLLIVCTVVKSKVKVSQNFVAFSEYMNFIYQNRRYQSVRDMLTKNLYNFNCICLYHLPKMRPSYDPSCAARSSVLSTLWSFSI